MLSRYIGEDGSLEDSSSSSAAEEEADLWPEPSTIRLRFFNFNMANIPALDPYDDVIDSFLETAFADSCPVDVAFVTLTEARFKMRSFVRTILSKWAHHGLPASGFDWLTHRNALKPETVRSCFPWTWCRAKVVQHVSGNVKTVLGYCREHFEVEDREELLGRFTRNPEKAFLGTSIVRKLDGLKLCFFGTHFPMQKLQAVLLDPTDSSQNRMVAAKIEYAKVLREVLSQVSTWKLANKRTVIFVQGDLNSRTIFSDDNEGGSEAKDVLLEVLSDAVMMAAISCDLNLPPGRWREVVFFEGVAEMPVTYKMHMKKNNTLAQPAAARAITMGEILTRVHNPSQPPPQPANPQRQLTSVNRKEFNEWGLKHDPATVKPSHFPAFTERVIYWAPDELACKISFSFPYGGYEVLRHIDSSDHRPVTLEVALEVHPGMLAEKARADCMKLPDPDHPLVKEMAQRLTRRPLVQSKNDIISEASSESITESSSYL